MGTSINALKNKRELSKPEVQEKIAERKINRMSVFTVLLSMAIVIGAIALVLLFASLKPQEETSDVPSSANVATAMDDIAEAMK